MSKSGKLNSLTDKFVPGSELGALSKVVCFV